MVQLWINFNWEDFGPTPGGLFGLTLGQLESSFEQIPGGLFWLILGRLSVWILGKLSYNLPGIFAVRRQASILTFLFADKTRTKHDV